MKNDKDFFTLVWKCRYETSFDFIKKVEEYLNLKFPLNYVDIVKAYDAFELSLEEFKEIYNMHIEEGKNNGFYKIAETFDEFMDMIQPYI